MSYSKLVSNVGDQSWIWFSLIVATGMGNLSEATAHHHDPATSPLTSAWRLPQVPDQFLRVLCTCTSFNPNKNPARY